MAMYIGNKTEEDERKDHWMGHNTARCWTSWHQRLEDSTKTDRSGYVLN